MSNEEVQSDSFSENCIFIALERFQVVKSSLFGDLLLYTPYVLLLGSAAALFLTGDFYAMYLSMMVAVALNFLIFRLLMGSIPETFEALWDRGIISGIPQIEGSKPGHTEGVDRFGVDLSRPSILKEQYAGFIHEMERELNSQLGQYFLAIAFSLMLLARSLYEFWSWLPRDFWTGLIYRAGGWDVLIEGIKLHLYVYFMVYSVEEPLRFWLGITLEPFLGFLLGIIAWRMLIVGKYIGVLNNMFDLDPRMDHPDGCGGMEPLGKLSLINASIISVWGIFLGGWIILGSMTKYGTFYEPLYLAVLSVPIIMAVVSFIIPLWGTHAVMASKKALLRKKLNRIALNIDQLSRKRIDSAYNWVDGDLNTAQELELLKGIYHENTTYPTWPFNYRIFVAFITSQAVPILGLTGIGTPILNAISSLMNFLGGIGK